MIDFFDTLGNTLNDIIGSHTNNNVGWAGNQIYGYAEGGEVTDTPSILQAIGTAGKQTLSGNRQDTSALGGNFMNSPAYLAQHFTSMGKFFTGGEPGNLYTNRYKQPEPSKPIQSDKPTDFYERFYERLRNFAQAEEIASRGQPNIRSR